MSEPRLLLEAPVRLEYTVTAGRHLSRFLSEIAKKRVIGARCPVCRKVYVPPRGACPTCGVPTGEEVEVAGTGTVTTFCLVNIAFEAQPFALPYAAAAILLDGADIPIFHLLQGLPAEEVRMGLRVRAHWVADDRLAPTLQSIEWFEPTGEPDAPYESYREHL